MTNTAINLNRIPKVYNMLSPRSGNEVANQFEIREGTNTYFQSYETIIAVYTNTGLVLDKNAMDYSVTTSRYLYQFTNQTRKELTEGIKEGRITVEDLNS